MAVYLALVRIAQCEICYAQRVLEGTDMPEKCIQCGSEEWEAGPEPLDGLLIRQGVTKRKRVLDKGVTSRARQQHGKAQFRRFHTREEEDAINAAKKLVAESHLAEED